MHRLRLSATALALAVLGWAAGCATPRPLVEPSFQARAYTPARIALLPLDVFAILDEVGDNDPEASAALGRAAAEQAGRFIAEALQRRGYDVDLSAGRDGVRAADGTVLITGQELGWLANSALRFASGPAGGGQGPMTAPAFVAPELASRIGWATQSDALLYVNIKGVAQTRGKRTAQAIGALFFVAIVVGIVLLILAEGRGGGGRAPATTAGTAPRTVRSAPGPGAAAPGTGSGALAPGGAPTTAVAAPRGHGRVPPRGGGRVYGGTHVSVGVGVVVPLSGPAHTHEGSVTDPDEAFGGDHIYVSMTLVNAHDGRVLWHLRDDFDVELDDPQDLQRFVDRALETVPASLRPAGLPPPAAAARPAAPPAAPPPTP